ncbi:MAG: segregation and condensation protein A [Acidimicrobiales bacterium]
MASQVRTPVFEGPFEVLLHLILREQVDLWELRLAPLVDAYLAEVARLGRLELDEATEFLLIAATLVELKARRLLPSRDELELDDELALWDQRDLLLTRLVEHRVFRGAARALAACREAAALSAPRTAGPEDRYLELVPPVLAGVTPERLRDAFLAASAPKPTPRVSIEHLAPIRVSVIDALEGLLAQVRAVGRASFRALNEGVTDRLEIVVRFLAVLELFKRGLVELDQVGAFGELVVSWNAGDGELSAADLVAVDAYDG